MDQLVQLVSEKTGLPEDQARSAAETVINFLKDRLPGPVAGQIDSVLEGKSVGGVSGVAKSLGGMFGGKSK